jgi:hypothetical protein
MPWQIKRVEGITPSRLTLSPPDPTAGNKVYSLYVQKLPSRFHQGFHKILTLVNSGNDCPVEPAVLVRESDWLVRRGIEQASRMLYDGSVSLIYQSQITPLLMIFESEGVSVN